MAYQIVDDILDFTGASGQLGKPAMADMQVRGHWFSPILHQSVHPTHSAVGTNRSPTTYVHYCCSCVRCSSTLIGLRLKYSPLTFTVLWTALLHCLFTTLHPTIWNGFNIRQSDSHYIFSFYCFHNFHWHLQFSLTFTTVSLGSLRLPFYLLVRRNEKFGPSYSVDLRRLVSELVVFFILRTFLFCPCHSTCVVSVFVTQHVSPVSLSLLRLSGLWLLRVSGLWLS